MIDIKLVREHSEILRKALESRNYNPSIVDELLKKDLEWRAKKKKIDNLRAERNSLGIKISQLAKEKKDAKELIKRSKEISDEIEVEEKEVKKLEDEIREMMERIPNIPHASVPVGKDESENIEIKKWGEIKKHANDVLPHYEIGEREGWLDFERGAKLSGHRFTVMFGEIAKLERALANFMLNVHISRGYKEVWVPELVRSEMLFGTGNLPKFAEDLYKTQDDLWLIPTAEVPLTNLHAGEILNYEELPKKYTALSSCFRREAGAYGKDIKGILRQHQFDKVELVKIVTQESSFEELESMVKDACYILELLELPYRVVQLCTGDLGFASAKTYDIEVWIPSQEKYREISSCSNCTDFQARRANIRYRDKNGELKFVHTLNGSGLAIGRTVIAIMENYQDDDGIEIPKVLRDYMGAERINFKKNKYVKK